METKTTYKSIRYKANTAWNSARRGTLSASGKPNIDVGSPPEFKGEPDIWAPEELLVGSVNTCMMLTFLNRAGVADRRERKPGPFGRRCLRGCCLRLRIGDERHGECWQRRKCAEYKAPSGLVRPGGFA